MGFKKTFLVGGVLAGMLCTIIYPSLLPMMGPNFGAINLYVENKITTGLIVTAYSAALIFFAVWLTHGKRLFLLEALKHPQDSAISRNSK